MAGKTGFSLAKTQLWWWFHFQVSKVELLACLIELAVAHTPRSLPLFQSFKLRFNKNIT